MITVVSMSRRPDLYKAFVEHVQKELGDLVSQFIVFVNDQNLVPFYKNFEVQSKNLVKLYVGTEDFVFKHGHDTVYNFLESKVQTDFILKLFDTDLLQNTDKSLLRTELTSTDSNIFGIPTYMQRGDVWEVKYQLYRKNVLTWYGLVHENQHFLVPAKATELKSFKVIHSNALDSSSKSLKKNESGLIILEKTEEGTDSDRRNLLYETLTWKIVHEGGRHDSPGWFNEHYRVNKEVIDWYYNRAREKYNL